MFSFIVLSSSHFLVFFEFFEFFLLPQPTSLGCFARHEAQEGLLLALACFLPLPRLRRGRGTGRLGQEAHACKKRKKRRRAASCPSLLLAPAPAKQKPKAAALQQKREKRIDSFPAITHAPRTSCKPKARNTPEFFRAQPPESSGRENSHAAIHGIIQAHNPRPVHHPNRSAETHLWFFLFAFSAASFMLLSNSASRVFSRFAIGPS